MESPGTSTYRALARDAYGAVLANKSDHREALNAFLRAALLHNSAFHEFACGRIKNPKLLSRHKKLSQLAVLAKDPGEAFFYRAWGLQQMLNHPHLVQGAQKAIPLGRLGRQAAVHLATLWQPYEEELMEEICQVWRGDTPFKKEGIPPERMMEAYKASCTQPLRALGLSAILSQRILNMKSCRGLIWSVRGTGAEHFLVGAVHGVPKGFTTKSPALSLLKRCKHAFFEKGADTDLPEWEERIDEIKIGEMVDGVMCHKAVDFGLKVHCLEPDMPDFEGTAQYDFQQVMHRLKSLMAVYCWGSGNEKLPVDTMDFADSFERRRHILWLARTDIVSRLQTSSEGHCIAVGLDHCVGREGLIELFRAKGLTVERYDPPSK